MSMRTNYAKPIHLFRGASSVRGWSKYQQTATGWTPCGIRRKARRDAAEATEDPCLMSCPFCKQLMRPSALKRDLREMFLEAGASR